MTTAHLARLFPAFLACFALTFAAPTLADASEEEARERFMQGREHYSNEEYLAAAEAFLEAYELSDRSELLFNVGQAYRHANRLSEAEHYYQEYLRLLPNAPNADDVADRIIEIQQERAALMATVEVTSDPDGVDVFVEDEAEPRCQAPCTLELDPGDVRIIGRASGYSERSTTVHLTERDAQVVRLRLEPTTRTGQLRVHSSATSGSVTVGGRSHRLGSSPITVEAGPQRVVVESGNNRWEETVNIVAEETLNVFVPLDGAPALSPMKMASLGLGGAAIAMVGAGALMGLQAQGTHDYLSTQQGLGIPADATLVDAGRRQQLMANGLWIGSVVFAGAAAGLWILDSRSSGGSDESQIEPTPEPAEPAPGMDLL